VFSNETELVYYCNLIQKVNELIKLENYDYNMLRHRKEKKELNQKRTLTFSFVPYNIQKE
jgi:pantothenate kinase-related protein Tda10